MKRSTLSEILVLLFTTLFLYTAVSKIIDYKITKEQIAMSSFGPAASSIAFLVPASELFTIILLLIPRWRLKGFYLCLALMALFTAYIIWIMSFNDKMPCSCGGALEMLSWTQHLFLNVFLIALAILGIWLEKRMVRLTKKRTSILSNSTTNNPILG